MGEVEFVLHGDLAVFVGRVARAGRSAGPAVATPVRRPVAAHSTVKDTLEALGIPHTEIGRVVADGREVALDERLAGAARVEVHPRLVATEPGDAPPRFLLDGHLGRLARHLRMLGVDAAYDRAADDETLARRAAEEGRILLTRDVGLLKRSAVARGSYVRAERPLDQLVEVVARFGLAAFVAPFGRCLRCNGVLEPVERAAVLDRLPPRTRTEFDEFSRCRGCGRVFWKGSHYERMERLVRDVVPVPSARPPRA